VLAVWGVNLVSRRKGAKVPGSVFGTKRQGEVEGWRELLNEEFQSFYSSPSSVSVVETNGLGCTYSTHWS